MIANYHKCIFFSLQICRGAYELLLTRDADAWSSVRSLDCYCAFNRKRQIPKLATHNHTPGRKLEISFKMGHLIQPFGDLFNGYSVGRNINSTKGYIGIYPTYKAVDVVVPVKILNYWKD